MVENAPRVDLTGQAAGTVTAAQALHAKQQASRQRSQDRRNRAKSKAQAPAPATDTAAAPAAD
jgi:ProP effector